MCAALPFQSTLALDPAKAITQYVHTVWRSDNGLPQNSVNRILETRDGYLWVGTQAGIARFDGVHFTVFDHTNTPAIHDDYIDDLAQDTDGTLWIATANGGVTLFKQGVFSHLDAIDARAGMALAADPDGSVWVGGYGGLAHLRGRKILKTYTVADGLAGDPVRRIVVDKAGSQWLATPAGLNHLVGDRIEAYSKKDGLPSNDVTNLYLAHDDTLWVQTQSAQVLRRINGHFETIPLAALSGPTIAAMQDRNGNLWLGSGTQGLFRLHDHTLSQFTTKEGLSSDVVSIIYEDRDGNVWVGTNEGGLDRFHDGSFTSYGTQEGLATEQTYAVIEDHAGSIWTTTIAGLERIDQQRVRLFTTADGLPTNSAWSLWEDHDHNLWTGTSGGGVAKSSGGGFVAGLPANVTLPPYMVSGIVEDRANRFWFSTRGGGLVAYADGVVSSYSRANGLLSNFVNAIALDRQGTLWVASTGGLNSITNGQIAGYQTDGLSDATALSLFVDNEDAVWIGSAGRGLFRFKDKRFTRYTTRQGLPDDTINNIVEDTATNLWIGSNKGIFRLDRADLEAVAAGTHSALQPVLFGTADGMKSSETNSSSQPAGWRARDGRLWFPTIRGLTVVDPARVFLSDKPPLARVEQLIADESDKDLDSPLRLAPGTRRLEIRYTAPNLSSPERTRFRYRLDGFDEQWVMGTTQRAAQYTNLPPGHYAFHVIASADNGRWATDTDKLGFDVLPQFYQTWWFHVMEGLAIVLVLFAIYRVRINWLQSRTAVLEERQRIAGDIHDSLAQGLSGIVFQTEAALISMQRAPNMTSTHLESARDLAKSSLDQARYSVLNLGPPVQDERSLLESLAAMARQLTGGRVDELDLYSSGEPWPVPAEARHHLVLLSQEAISNAIQHGKARTISIDLTFARDALRLSISDNGVGFVPNTGVPTHARGNGMRNMHHRAHCLGATLTVSSEVGNGTGLNLNVPRRALVARVWNRLRGRDIARIDS